MRFDSGPGENGPSAAATLESGESSGNGVDYPLQQAIEAADALFREGRFEEAQAAYRGAPDEAAPVALGLGRIALLQDRLGDAEAHLRMAFAGMPGKSAPIEALSDLYRRRGDLKSAGACFDYLGSHVVAETLRRLDGEPVRSRLSGPKVEARFEKRALPLVSVRINGVDATFLLDTGSEDPVIDSALAERAGLMERGLAFTASAGGSLAVGYGIAERLELGGAGVEHLALQVQPLAERFTPFADGIAVEGVLGMSFLHRFDATLDFGRGTLSLQARGSGEPPDPAVPLRLVGAGLPLVRAEVNGAPCNLLLDSGEAGYDLILSAAAAERTGVAPAAPSAGVGASGGIAVIEASPARWELGGLARTVRPAVLSDFPLEFRWGFRVDGLMGHDLLRCMAVRLDFSRGLMGMEPAVENG